MVKTRYLHAFCLVVVLAGSQAADCRGEGMLLQHSCTSYTSCSQGRALTRQCTGSTVFSQDIGDCAPRKTVPPPCGDLRDCSLMDDGTYPDSGCHSFYTCKDGVFVGHGMCPGGLVYSTKVHGCDWADYVPPPCGTQGGGGLPWVG